jgi:hypothetical protein
MISPTFVADRLSGLNLRLRFRNRARRRRGTSVARLAPADWLLEDRCLMSDIEMPLAPPNSGDRYNTVSNLSGVLFLGNPTVGNVPVKQITLYNNTTQTIYPFLYDPNTGKSTAGGRYDPFDGLNQEYRGYIGYRNGGMDFLGLQQGQSITINVPLVFWDSGRAAIATDGANLLPADPNTSKASPITNPFFFLYKNLDGTNTARFVVDAASSSGGNGIIMYYHSNDPLQALDPGSDAPDQLIEFTIRDKDFLTKVSTPTNPIASNQLITLINYDVSYVDHLLLPVAMEALNVPVPNTNVKQDYGWIGAKQAYGRLAAPGTLQGAIKAFTSNTADNGLGTSFRDNGINHGWPSFFNPNYSLANQGVGIRIPGGANIFFDSPLAGKRSSYGIPFGPNNHWMLSSGGQGPIQFTSGGTFRTPNKAVVGNAAILSSLTRGMTVKGNDNVILGKIDSIDIPNKTVFVVPNPNIPDNTPESFVFLNPATDLYATKLRDLWYSWADYYQKQFPTFTDRHFPAVVSTDTDNNKNDYRILSFGQVTHPELAVGMQVTGGGITRLTTILKITTVQGVQQVYLSAPVPNHAPATFTFSKPQPIAFAGQATIIPMKFTTVAEQQFAAAFAGTVYEILSVFSTAPRQVPALPGSMEVVGNSIGGNVGFLPTATPIDYVNISADVRDQIKSVLRGVPDFTKPPYDNPATWYPAPSTPTGNQTYNVFNLDPYVWFIHAKLGLSGYGFSFDDDTADVGANDASQLAVTVGGLNGLNNKVNWGPSAQWGTVSSLATISQGTGGLAGTTINTLQYKTVYNQVRPNDPNNSVIGAYVSGVGSGIIPGTNLAATADIGRNQFVLSQNAPSSANPVLLTFTAKPPA